ncbi:hypothetical protein BC832DRAFT_595518 [Gaertneriomyces semiglobifer]|nr:hypothetical protein BC832DRAFT_595518 [Gaertneriomyces semiglobifer]
MASNIYTPPPPPSSSSPVPLHKIPVGSLKHTQTVEALLQRRISTRHSLSSAPRRAATITSSTSTTSRSSTITTTNGFLVPTAVRTTSLSFPVSYVINGNHHHPPTPTTASASLASSTRSSSYHPLLGRMCKPKTLSLSVDPSTTTTTPSTGNNKSTHESNHPRRLRRSQSLTRHTARSNTVSGQPTSRQQQQQQQQGFPKRQRCQSVTLGFLKEARRRSRVYASASELVSSLGQNPPVEWAAVAATRREVLETDRDAVNAVNGVNGVNGGGACDVASSLAAAAEPGSVYTSYNTSSSPVLVSVDDHLHTSPITSSSDAFPPSEQHQKEDHQPAIVSEHDSSPIQSHNAQVGPYIDPLVHPLLPLTTCKLVRSSLPLRHRLHCYHLLLDLQPLFACSGEMSGYDRLTVNVPPTRKRKRDRKRLVSIAEGKRTTPSPLRYEVGESRTAGEVSCVDSDSDESCEEDVDLNRLLFKESRRGFKPADCDDKASMTVSSLSPKTTTTIPDTANSTVDDIEPYDAHHHHTRKHVTTAKSKRQSIISVRPKRSFSQELRYKICMTLKLDRFTASSYANNDPTTSRRASFTGKSQLVGVSSYDTEIKRGSVDGVPRSERKEKRKGESGKRGLRKKVSRMFMGERVKRREAEFYVAVEA